MNTNSLRFLSGSFAIFASARAFAVTETWDGGGLADNLSLGANWADNSAPVSDILNTDLIFAGVVRLTPSVTAALSVRSVTFNNTAGAFVIGGSQPLTVGTGGISNDDSQTMTFNNLVTFGGASGLIDATAGGLTFNDR